MAERILRLHNHGVVTELTHLNGEDAVQLEFSDPTDDDPIEWVNVHVRSAALPVFKETFEVDEANDDTPGPMLTVREMLPRDALVLNPDDVTVEQLKDILRDKELPVSGSKQELIDRLNEAALENDE